MFNKKNVLIWYWGRFGGAQRYTYELINEILKINKKKNKINLYYSYSNDAELSSQFKSLKINQYPIKTFKNSTQAVLKTLNLFKIRKQFFSFLKKKNINVIFCPMFHYWNPYFTSKFKSMNIKYIFGIHDYNLHPGESNILKKKIYDIEKKNADKYVCFSKYIYQKFIKNKIKKKNVLLSELATKNLIIKKEKKINKLKFVFFGRFLKYKGIHKLINIFSKKYYIDNNISLTLIGRKDKSFLLPKIKTPNINVILKWIDESKLDKILNKYDVCILPYDEASQSGIVEIMFRNSIPLIVTPVGGLGNQIKNNFNGLVSKNKTISSIEDEIKKIINLKVFYKLRKGAIESAILNNKNFSKKISILYDFLK